MRLEKDYAIFPDMAKALGSDLQEIEKAAAAIEARPCPFCGGEAVVTLGLISRTGEENIIPFIRISCMRCNARTARKDTGAGEMAIHSLHEVAAAWNRRESP